MTGLDASRGKYKVSTTSASALAIQKKHDKIRRERKNLIITSVGVNGFERPDVERLLCCKQGMAGQIIRELQEENKIIEVGMRRGYKIYKNNTRG